MTIDQQILIGHIETVESVIRDNENYITWLKDQPKSKQKYLPRKEEQLASLLLLITYLKDALHDVETKTNPATGGARHR